MDEPTAAGAANPFHQIHDLDVHHEDSRKSISIEQLVQQIKETADKLIRDGANRGDVKLLSTALKELRYCFKIFGPYRNHRKVTIFGSARLPLDHPACKTAEAFAQRMVAANYMIITGAASGIMEAGHIGAGRDASIGVNILLPFEQSANPIIAGDHKLMHLKYFFTRKLLFVKESDAVALFPGGFGTQDEGFEVLTLVQTGKSHLFPIVLVDEPGGDYWKQWHDYIEGVLMRRALISPSDLALYKVTDSAEEAAAEILQFYRVYHSMRYVGDQLVLRLQKQLTGDFLEKLRTDFADIVLRGTIEQSTALPAESSDPHLAQLPRLRFHFNRYSLGRLRLMIDAINTNG